MDKILGYFFDRALDRVIKVYIKHHLKRVKKAYLKRVGKTRMINYRVLPSSTAYINFNPSLPVIVFQLPVFRNIIKYKMAELINDNVIDGIRHEFAHLKYRDEGKQHLKWMKQIKLFKK